MGNNLALAQQLPADAFDPQPDLARLATNLVKVGIYIASSAISAALRRPLHPVVALALGNYMQYAFDIALALIFFFGVGMILIGWMVSDAPGTHTAFARIMLRASQIVLVFAIALHEFASTSTAQANSTTK